MIEHLRHSEIDKALWDAQLLRCGNRMWYIQSWVLDHVAPGWEALVDRERGALMPLTWRRKYGIRYLFQPFGIQQLGVFAPAYDALLGNAFVAAIPKEFRYWDIAVNESMQVVDVPGVRTSPLDQQVLSLAHPVDELRKNYSTGHLRNLRKSTELPVIDLPDPAAFVQLYAATTGRRFGSARGSDMQALQQLIREALDRGQCSIQGIRSAGTLHAAACYMIWEGRAIFLKSAADDTAYGMKAMFKITDAFIAEHAASGLLLDFAGSNTPSVARFNSGFGAERRIYLRLQRNDLPPPLRWFKK
jgi:hypothetical protein